jgi:hypothetical protein
VIANPFDVVRASVLHPPIRMLNKPRRSLSAPDGSLQGLEGKRKPEGSDGATTPPLCDCNPYPTKSAFGRGFSLTPSQSKPRCSDWRLLQADCFGIARHPAQRLSPNRVSGLWRQACSRARDHCARRLIIYSVSKYYVRSLNHRGLCFPSHHRSRCSGTLGPWKPCWSDPTKSYARYRTANEC